jgi:hypothetical protein
MKHIILIFFCTIYLTTSNLGQPGKDCFEIKYLDFFGIENLDTLKWPPSEIDPLLETDFAEDEGERKRKTNFLIPFIVLQLKDYHPSCSGNSDTATFRKLKEIYFKIRQQDVSAINGKPVATQLEIIREDYYRQVQNDSLLPYMEFTLDDGPFYGELTHNLPDYAQGKSFKMEFGTLFITNHSGKVFLTVVNNQNEHLWTRIMTGSGDRYLSQVGFSDNNIMKTSLGYQLRMYSEGEALHLYLKCNGEFRYYYHSW